MLGSVGGLVEVISKVVDNVVASDAEEVLKTVRGYVTRSFMRFIYLFNFLPHRNGCGWYILFRIESMHSTTHHRCLSQSFPLLYLMYEVSATHLAKCHVFLQVYTMPKFI